MERRPISQTRLEVIAVRQGRKLIKPTPIEPPAEVTTVFRSGEVVRKSPSGRLTQRRPIDPIP